MHPDIVEILEKIHSRDLSRWLSWIFVAAVVALIGAFSTYAIFFFEHPFVVNADAWGKFGDFIGGTVNPVIGFLTVVALVLTLTLQNRQLELSSRQLKMSRQELEMTRRELERSAKAQELSECALRAQAESAARTSNLTALNFLLASYRAELTSLQSMAFVSNDSRAQRTEMLLARTSKLNQLVDDLFSEIAEK